MQLFDQKFTKVFCICLAFRVWCNTIIFFAFVMTMCTYNNMCLYRPCTNRCLILNTYFFRTPCKQTIFKSVSYKISSTKLHNLHKLIFKLGKSFVYMHCVFKISIHLFKIRQIHDIVQNLCLSGT